VQSTFAPIELGKRGTRRHHAGLQTIGHNMSNASVEGYSRQRVEMVASPPFVRTAAQPRGDPGPDRPGRRGVPDERIKDMLLEGRIVSEQNVQGYWDSRDKYILMMEQVYNEPTEHSVRTLMDKFWSFVAGPALHPTEIASRRSVLEEGKALVDGIHARYRGLKSVRDMLEGDVQGSVTQVNELTSQIADLKQADREVTGPRGQPERSPRPPGPPGGQALPR